MIDFLNFYKNLILAFDPSYISKSGKQTLGLSWYWYGCAGNAKWGIEIGGLAVVNIDNHTEFHLEAVQTICAEDKTLTEGIFRYRKNVSTKLGLFPVY